jgi:hypothetical protein
LKRFFCDRVSAKRVRRRIQSVKMFKVRHEKRYTVEPNPW